jgi:hypothetical protein
MLDDAVCHKLLAVVAAAAHQRVGQALHDGALAREREGGEGTRVRRERAARKTHAWCYVTICARICA